MSLFRDTSRSGAATEHRVYYQNDRRDECLYSRLFGITHDSIAKATKVFLERGGVIKYPKV